MMRRYPAYKDSRVQWLGEVPEGWTVTKLGNLCRELQTGPFGSQLHADDYVTGGTPLINPSNIHGQMLVADSDVAVDAATARRLSNHSLKAGDIVVGRRGELGRCAVVTEAESGWICGTGSLRVRLFEQANLPSFIADCIRTTGVREWLRLQSVGSTMDNLNAAILAGIPLAVPPLPEQQAIAAFLDRETAKIDALVAEQRRLIELLKEKRQAVISHAVTKGLDPTAPMKDSGIDWLGEVPEGWEVLPLRRVIAGIESGTSVNAVDTPAGLGDVGVLKTSCVYTGTFDPGENKAVVAGELDRVSCPLRIGTLIVSRMNTPDLVGAAGYVSDACDGIFLPDRLWQVQFSSADAAFVHFWTLTEFYRDQVRAVCSGTSSSMQNLSQDNFRSFRIALPSPAEQDAITAWLNGELPRFDALTMAAAAAITLLQERRAALISAAVTGKIDVRDTVASTEAA